MMKIIKLLALSTLAAFVGTLPATASTSLQPLNSQLNISWDNDNGSALQNSDGTWFFSILEPPSSNDILAHQAVGGLTAGLNVIKDDDPTGGTATSSLNGIDNGDGTITWESTGLPSLIAFKFARDWYSVWTTDMATFDAATGLWSETITIGDTPQGALSHTAILPDGGVTLAMLGLGLVGLAAMRRKLAKA